MIHWLARIRIYSALPCFAQPFSVGMEEQVSRDYYYRGSERIDDSCIFQYTLSGRGTFTHGGKAHDVGPETAFLTHAMDPQMEYGYPLDAERPWSMLWLGFQGPIANDMVQAFTARHGHVFRLPRNTGIIEELLSFQGYASSTLEMTPTQGALLLAELFSELEDSVQTGDHKSAATKFVVQAQRAINETSDFRRFSISRLAEQLDVSREHLSRVFRQQMGTSIHDYVVRCKMNLASRLLKQTTLSHKRIAAQLGYASQANFSRCFKSAFNMTPSQFKASRARPLEF